MSRPKRDPLRFLPVLDALAVYLEREHHPPTGQQLAADSRETYAICQEVLHALRKHGHLQGQVVAPHFIPIGNSIGNLIESLIASGGDFDSACQSESNSVELNANRNAGSFSPMGGTFPTKRKGKFFLGAFTPITTREEQERLDRALKWLKQLVRRVPVEHRTGLRYPDHLADTLEQLSVDYPFPDPDNYPICLLKPRSLDHRTERQAMEAEIARYRDVADALRLVVVWDFWEKKRPPQETHGVVSLIWEWVDWSRAHALAEEGEHMMGMPEQPDVLHRKNVWAAALLMFKYGFAVEQLRVVVDRANSEKMLKRVTKRRQFDQQLRLPHLWSPDYFPTYLLAAENEDPEAFARELEHFKKGEQANKERGPRS